MHELGRGQFGRVWLARWQGVEVAMKEPHQGACRAAQQAMLGEARTLAALRHPCVLALYGVSLDQVGAPLISCTLACHGDVASADIAVHG